MITLLNQGNDMGYVYVVIVVILIMLLPTIVLLALGFYFRKKKPKTSKILFIAAGICLLIGLGYCGLRSI